jgi:hypothetical protein
MKKPAIPALLGVKDPALMRILTPVKENIELLTGVRGGTIEELPEKSSLSSTISKINEISGRLNSH